MGSGASQPVSDRRNARALPATEVGALGVSSFPVYLRFLGQTDRNWQNREHFFSVAAQVYVSC